MTRFIFSDIVAIPKEKLPDVRRLREFITDEMNIFISLKDAYLLWLQVSLDTEVEWMSTDPGEDPNEFKLFVKSAMDRYGYLQHSYSR